MTIKETLMSKKTNPHDLTEDEIEFLRSAKVPNEVKGYLARQHENIGTKISAYRKVAAAARAECDALLAVQDLAALHGDLADLDTAKRRVMALERRTSELEASAASKDREILRRTAQPALAVHSGR